MIHTSQKKRIKHDFLSHFENTAELYGLEKEKWNTKLTQALKGQAYEVYQRLPLGHENDFDCPRNALLKRYELSAIAYRNKFCMARREKGETYAKFTTRLETYLKNLERLGEFTPIYKGSSEIFLAEQVRETMPKTLQTFLIENGVEKLDYMLVLAERHLEAHRDPLHGKERGVGPKEEPKIQPNSHQAPQKPSTATGNALPFQNHSTAHWDNRPSCDYCRMREHDSSDCRKKTTPSHPACLTLAICKRLARAEPHTSGTWPLVVEEISLNNQVLVCMTYKWR